jgi:hypothetical protein
MSVQANWFRNDVSLIEEDPFDDGPASGTVIDLTGSEAQLAEQVADLLKREGRLWNQGVRCAIKQETENVCCSVCPLSQHANPDSDLHPLCKIGREQERTLTQLAVLRHADD